MTEIDLWKLPVGAFKRKTPLPKGHAGPVGTGPKGETCGTCKHLHRKKMGKTYLKCELTRKSWTGGGGSDVRAKDAACWKWMNDTAHPPHGRGKTSPEE